MQKTYEYVIFVDDRVFERGKNLKRMYELAKKKYPDKKISIKWEPPEGILIAIQTFRLYRKG